MSSTLFAYSLTAHVRRKKDEPLSLDGLYGDGTGDVFDVFDVFIQEGLEWPPPPEDGQEDLRKTVLEVESVVTPEDDDRVRYGRVRVQRHAIRHDIEQAASGEIIEITDDDLEGRPLFFWFGSPAGSNTGLLLTERAERFGILTALWKRGLVGALRGVYEAVTFDLSYYAPVPVWDEYLEKGQGIEGAVLRRVIEEEDETKEETDPARRKMVGKVVTAIERRVIPTKKRVADALREADRSEAIEMVIGDHEEVELDDPDEYDTVQIVLDIDGSRRTVTIGKDRIPQIGYPVHGVDDTEDDYPDLEDLAAFAADLAIQIGGPAGF